MPRKPSTINRSDVRSMIRLVKEAGLPINGVKFFADGTFRLVTAGPEPIEETSQSAFDAWKERDDARPS